jgi:hypothetical protein
MAEPSLTIDEFCALEKISRAFFYKLDRQGKAPRTYRAGVTRRITPEMHDEWRRAREADGRGVPATEEHDSAA